MSSLKRVSSVYLSLTVFLTAILISSNVVAVKIIDVWGVVVPAGIILFPLSYILNDVLAEVYGFSLVRRSILLAFAGNLIFVLSIYLAIKLPGAAFWSLETEFEQILGFTPRLLTASFIAYLVGSFVNSWVMVKLKSLTNSKYLWLRTIGSTIIGEGLDSLVFIVIAFGGMYTSGIIMMMLLTQWTVKVVYEVIATPLTYKAVHYIEKIENIDK